MSADTLIAIGRDLRRIDFGSTAEARSASMDCCRKYARRRLGAYRLSADALRALLEGAFWLAEIEAADADHPDIAHAWGTLAQALDEASGLVPHRSRETA
jgi:hypothetical protein